MKRQGMRMAVIAAAAALMMTVPGNASDLSDFLTGGNAGQTTQPAGETGNTPLDTGSSPAGSAAAQALSFVPCTDSQTGINVARAVVPQGYNVTSETTWCGIAQSPDYPASVFVSATSPDGSIQLTYESALEFVQHLENNVNGLDLNTHQDFAFDPDLVMMMLTYMNAPQFCDFISRNYVDGAVNMTFVSEEPLSQEDQTRLQQYSQQELDGINQLYSTYSNGSIYADYVETTAAQRTYHYTDSATGKQKVLIVSAAVQGVRTVSDFSGYGLGNVVMANVVWSVPGRYCLMCDADRLEEGKAIFEAFCSNTTISDQFKQEMKRLSDKITEIVLNARSGGGTGGLETASDTVLDTFSSDLGSQDDSYSSVEAWDDVIMERNDYTLSSGDRVKVDTSYDYVYELPDGGVYATNSALDEPSGSTRLYAN